MFQKSIKMMVYFVFSCFVIFSLTACGGSSDSGSSGTTSIPGGATDTTDNGTTWDSNTWLVTNLSTTGKSLSYVSVKAEVTRGGVYTTRTLYSGYIFPDERKSISLDLSGYSYVTCEALVKDSNYNRLGWATKQATIGTNGGSNYCYFRDSDLSNLSAYSPF